MAHTKIQLLAIVLAICITVGYARVPKKILRGQNAWIQELPYQVSLQATNGIHFCGGTIIDALHILTAAHCLVDDNLQTCRENIYVVTGTPDVLYRSFNNVFRVTRSIYHHNYNPNGSIPNDIAILQLDIPILFNEFQQPAWLPIQDTFDFTPVVSSGWGATSYNKKTERGGNFPRYLQKITQIVIPLAECQMFLPRAHITHGYICVWAPRGTGPCMGDSGGPLTQDGVVVGITSWGMGCGSSKPNIYTRVYHYMPWILNALAVYI